MLFAAPLMVSVFKDRMVKHTLRNKSLAIFETLQNQGGPRYIEKDTVHFCGLLGAATGEMAVFLPRNCGGHDNLQTARLTVQALARYGRETESRRGHEIGNDETVSVLPIIHDLARDFTDYGIYAERQRYKSRDTGKPDWKSTIASEVPLLRQNGVAVYPVMRTTRVIDSRDVPLARIQAAVLREINERHGWWLDADFSGAARALAAIDKPRLPRALWSHALREALNGLYAARPMTLATLLIRYLDENRSVTGGAFIAGVADFERVWEVMLRQVLPREESKRWNSRLPKPAYVDKDDKIQKIGSGMEMDIVLREPKEGADHLHILDAKYYAATGTGSVPKTGDIVKQLMYEKAMEAAIENAGTGETVSGGFVFPSGGHHAQPFVKAGLTSGQTIDYRFPTIHIHYVDIFRVMSAYVSRKNYHLGL